MSLKNLHLLLAIQLCLLTYIDNYSLKPNSNDQELQHLINNIKSEFDSDVCESSVCESTGKSLKVNLNTSVDPCDDFYEFACGGWLASHSIPENQSEISNSEAIVGLVTNKIKESLIQNRDLNDSKALVFASNLYKSCIDMTTLEFLGIKPIKSALDSLGGWPLISNSFNEQEFDWKRSFVSIVAVFNEMPIFSIDVRPDINNTIVNRFYFSSGSFGMSKTKLSNQSHYPNEVEKYKHLILQSALIMGAKNNIPTVQQIDEIVAFEAKLANASLVLAQNDPKTLMTFSEFNNLTDNKVDWIDIINKIYTRLNSTVQVKSDELVFVTIDYSKEVLKIIEKTPKKVVANYLAWKVIMANGGLTNPLKDILPTFFMDCLMSEQFKFGFAISRLYIDRSFTKKDKQVATDIVDYIKVSFNELMKTSDWLDTTTRNKAIFKLNAINDLVGYPDWILNNTELDNFYNLTKKADPKTFFENIIHLKQRDVLEKFNSLRINRRVLISDPAWPILIDGNYDPKDNSITIPAAILNLPFFDAKLPAQFNFGAIGQIIGHELTHGFDNSGSRYDANGKMVNWWTDKVKQNFNNKLECFINEYNSILDPQTNMRLNGKHTAGENIADNGGIREAFHGCLNYVKKYGIPQLLPHISQYSTEQQFFDYVVNAEYVAKRNIININAGILNPPHFDGRLPAHINYGAIGQIIGHELTHAFDDTGSKYDAKGNLVNWFTDKVKQRFNEKVKCFVDQYNNILEPQINMKLNGSHTAGENIADNGGIREAFSGYLNYVKKHGKPQLLPHISQYTVEQQFFISYANTACSKYTDQYLKNLIMRDPHSPNKYRVNLPLANFQTFSDVFKCPSNSRMNRKDKCVMW